MATAKKSAAKKAGAKKAAAKGAAKGGAKSAAKGGASRGGAATKATEITKRVWDYIKKNGLQDQNNKRQINADDRLRPVFGGKSSVSMFEMTKLVNGHLSGG